MSPLVAFNNVINTLRFLIPSHLIFIFEYTKMNRLISIFIFSLAAVSSVLSFTWENCGPNTNPITLQELSLKRTGDLFYVSMKMNIGENITQPIEANMRIKKKVPFFNYYVDVPCIDNVGSCNYEDICAIDPWKNKPCPKEFVKNNLPCRCPLIQNHYEVKELPLDLKPFEDEIEGTYKVKLLLQKGGNELFCVKMKIKI